jgi:FkbM family methyltransferase
MTLTRAIGALATALDPYWFRGKGRFLRWCCPREGIAQRVVFGVPVSLDLSDWVQRSIFLGVYEPQETQWLLDYLRPGMVVVDVGANVGYYTLLARAAIGPSGRVIAFEPAERPRARLLEAVRQFDNVTVVNSAVGGSAGVGVLYSDDAAGNDTPTLVAQAGRSRTDVSIRTLDECLAGLGVEQVDLLKVDVEGWEPQVLAGARRLLERHRIGAVLCEFNSYWLEAAGSNASTLWQMLMDAGFVDARSGQSMPKFSSGNATRFFLFRGDDGRGVKRDAARGG